MRALALFSLRRNIDRVLCARTRHSSLAPANKGMSQKRPFNWLAFSPNSVLSHNVRKLDEPELVHWNRAFNPIARSTRTPFNTGNPASRYGVGRLFKGSYFATEMGQPRKFVADQRCRHFTEVNVYFGTPAFSNNSPIQACWSGFLVRRRPPSHFDTDASGLSASNSSAA